MRNQTRHRWVVTVMSHAIYGILTILSLSGEGIAFAQPILFAHLAVDANGNAAQPQDMTGSINTNPRPAVPAAIRPKPRK
jgi:hypothetical protein